MTETMLVVAAVCLTVVVVALVASATVVRVAELREAKRPRSIMEAICGRGDADADD